MFTNKLIVSTLKGNIYRRINTSCISKAHWNKDWLPGPYPKTEEERIAAAKKYGMHPKEYEPYPDDGTGYGDYPKLPFKGVALRDPNYPYDYPGQKRNFNEPIHIDIAYLCEERYAAGERERFTTTQMIITFILVFGGLYAGQHYAWNIYNIFQPIMEKQMPYTNKRKYYTFEIEK